MRKPHWTTQGQEPDYRFTLANERTFLAWMRTALALLAAGVLFDQFMSDGLRATLTHLVGKAFIAMAAAISVLAFLRWRASQLAMRLQQPLRHGWAAVLLAALLGCLALLLLLLAWL